MSRVNGWDRRDYELWSALSVLQSYGLIAGRADNFLVSIKEVKAIIEKQAQQRFEKEWVDPRRRKMTTKPIASKYRKKPITIEAVQWNGYNFPDIQSFVPGEILGRGFDNNLRIETLEGIMEVSQGDWIIKGVKGEFYPCKPDIFKATYEATE